MPFLVICCSKMPFLVNRPPPSWGPKGKNFWRRARGFYDPLIWPISELNSAVQFGQR